MTAYTAEQKQYCAKLYAQGYFPVFIAKQATIKFGIPIKNWHVCSWAEKAGVPLVHYHRRFKERPERTCPLCQYSGKVKPAGGSPQRYICPECGTNFTDTGLCGIGKYSEELRSIAINLYVSDVNSTFTSVARIINQNYAFHPPLRAVTVERWVTSKNFRHPREQELRNRIYQRTQKYGSSGLPERTRLKLSKWLTALWQDPEHRSWRMRAIHEKRWKEHTPDLRAFCVELHQKNPEASMRSICREARQYFGFTPSHHTVVSWVNQAEGIMWKRALMVCPKCPKCGSQKVIGAGHAITKEGKKQLYKCHSCNFHFRSQIAVEGIIPI